MEQGSNLFLGVIVEFYLGKQDIAMYICTVRCFMRDFRLPPRSR
jgi:hypothetical protein